MVDNNDVRLIVEQLKKELIPVGSILIFSSKKVPDNYLPCDGRELSKQQYSELYALIGDTWGETETTFFLPDLQGQFIRGWDKEQNIDPERVFGSYQEDALQGHKHDVVLDASKIHTESAGGHLHYVGCNKYPTYERDGIFSTTYHHEHVCSYDAENKSENKTTDRDGAHTHDFNIEKGFVTISNAATSNCGIVRTDVETRPKNIALLYCIKAK